MPSEDASPVLYEKTGHIATITIDRPEALNAYNRPVLLGLESALLDFKRDDNMRVAILTGTGSAFCAGADLKQIARDEDAILLYERAPGELISSLQNYDLDVWKPIIAAVNGHALAGGLVLALACDIRVAAEDATFGVPMIKHGLTPGNALYFMAQHMPIGAVMEFALTGDQMTAADAYRFGLVNRVVPSSDVLAEAMEIAHRICQNPPDAVRLTKESVMRSMNESFTSGIRLCQLFFAQAAARPEAKQGVAAWVDRKTTPLESRIGQ